MHDGWGVRGPTDFTAAVAGAGNAVAGALGAACSHFLTLERSGGVWLQSVHTVCTGRRAGGSKCVLRAVLAAPGRWVWSVRRVDWVARNLTVTRELALCC